MGASRKVDVFFINYAFLKFLAYDAANADTHRRDTNIHRCVRIRQTGPSK